MSSNNNSNSGVKRIVFAGLLTIVFITLKLCGIINWSWWWVLSPWISVVLAITALNLIVLFIIIPQILKK